MDRVLQCIEEAHELKGQDVRLLGDGTPKLSPSTYCAALNALASCQSVGMRDGTKARRVSSSRPYMRAPHLELLSETSSTKLFKRWRVPGVSFDRDA